MTDQGTPRLALGLTLTRSGFVLERLRKLAVGRKLRWLSSRELADSYLPFRIWRAVTILVLAQT
jgi:hypothetical protein